MKHTFFKKFASLLVGFLLLFNTFAVAQAQEVFYHDVPSNYWARTYIGNLLGKKVVVMPDNRLFEPERPVNRAEFVTMVVKALYPSFSPLHFQNGGSTGFPDVVMDIWYGPVVAFSKQNNILSGYHDGTFKPANNITRAEAMSVIARALKVKLNQNPVLPYSDVTIQWQKPGIHAVNILQIATGYNANQFGPNDPLTRAQAAKIVDRSMEVQASESRSASGEIVLPDSAYQQNPNQTPNQNPDSTPGTTGPVPTFSIDPQTSTYLAPAPGQVQTSNATIVESHPRLWVTQADLPTLRSWAVDSNPMYSQGIKQLAEEWKADMDAGRVPGQDNGQTTWTPYPTEAYAQIFAFMSLIENDQQVRDDYARRARTLLMHIINEAAKGDASAPFRHPNFSTYDRSRWFGSAFPTTVDWIYPHLSAADKTQIRKVFLTWIDKSVNAYNQRPSNLRANPQNASVQEIRRSLNNYQTSQLRQIGLMSLAMDPADDPNGELRGKLKIAEDYLWAADQALKEGGRGGLPVEGFQYGPDSLGRPMQFMLAMATAGADNTSTCPCRLLENNPFWAATVPAYLHSLSSEMTGRGDYGNYYEPAWYGDGDAYEADDPIPLFGPLALYYKKKNIRPEFVENIRYIQKNLQSGGANRLYARASDENFSVNAIFYFLLFDPSSQEGTDPRPKFGLNYIAEGIGRILSRTSFDPGSSWFTYKLGWNNMDHQHGDGNMFELYRKGEWLTKERTGYGVRIGGTYKNTLSLENNRSTRGSGDYNFWNWEDGAQYYLTAKADGQLRGYSFGSDYTYALGDATGLYNSDRAGTNSVTHASRSIVWLKPDFVFIYDRATTNQAGLYKRFILNTPNLARVNGNRSIATTPKGQQVILTTILPANAVITAAPSKTEAQMNNESDIARGYTMHHHIQVEAPGEPADARFLNVLQGADAGATPQSISLVQSTSGTSFSGAVAGNVAVLFPVSLSSSFNGVTYVVPSNVTKQYVTGLNGKASYGVTITTVENGLQVSITSNGSTQVADSGGVLVINNEGTTVSPFQNNAVGAQNVPTSIPPTMYSGSVSSTPSTESQRQVAPTNTDSEVSSNASSDQSSSTSSSTNENQNSSSGSSASVADLSSLAISGGTLSPTFSASTPTYTLTVPSSATNVSITAHLNNPNAHLLINGNAAVSGEARSVGFWNNVIRITVQDENWRTTKEYTLNVQKS